MNANEFTEKQIVTALRLFWLIWTFIILVMKERQYLEKYIESLIDLYNDKINKMLEIPKNVKWEVFVLEKSKVNMTKHKDMHTKDGIHLIIGIQMDHTLQQMLRNRVLEDIGDYLVIFHLLIVIATFWMNVSQQEKQTGRFCILRSLNTKLIN